MSALRGAKTHEMLWRRQLSASYSWPVAATALFLIYGTCFFSRGTVTGRRHGQRLGLSDRATPRITRVKSEVGSHG